MLKLSGHLMAVLAGSALSMACSSLQSGHSPPWAWTVTVLGDSSDTRYGAIVEATRFWNQQLAALGISLRFDSVTTHEERIPQTTLSQLSATIIGRGRARPPSELGHIPGDLVVAFSESPDFTSFGVGPAIFSGRGLVALRPANILPLSAPNVARNVAAHEIGHVLGLRHNSSPRTLMCMPPAPCRPLSYRADTIVFFPLTGPERQQLINRWRSRERGDRRLPRD